MLLAAAALFGLQVLIEAFHPAVNRFADLQVYAGSTRSLLAGGSLYDYVRGNGDVFTYPPAAGYLFVWTGWLPTPVVWIAWSVLSAGAFTVLAFCLAAGLGLTVTPITSLAQDPWGLVGVIAVVLVASAPGRSNIAFGQASVIVVALAAADLLLLANRRTAGALLGVAIAVKLTPLLFVPLLWWSGRRRQARMAMATGAAITAVAWLISRLSPSSTGSTTWSTPAGS